ncbi:MAG: hypothetical protein B7Z75_07120 [Acidocella sp. 20-57-95]|nr:MAG: hypothetical protein B7Z75_07120 [Acidocella sp. 20-57-95]OYV58207.1 MAG: hypothetical protein B7Z71_10825 [Acidocella sp. 21-58-7]HQT63554.1 hypothetical protein [Acidocella sp.]HQU04771.1 hypothetical protein [Acidocella sp.]
MKPRTIARLDLMTAAKEAQIRNEISQLTAKLADLAEQRRMLSRYHDQLGQSWRASGVISASTAQRAGTFVTVARLADAQIMALESQSKTQLAQALQNLAAIQSRRGGLEQAAKHAWQADDRRNEHKHDLELTSQYRRKQNTMT